MINHLLIQQNKNRHKLTGFSDMYFDGMYTVVVCNGGKYSLKEVMKNVILPKFLKRETSVPIEMTR